MNVHDDRIAEFRRLHATGCFVMPNPWDVGSARVLEQMGFKALATTSAGLAWTLGRADNRVTLDQVLEHLRVVVDAVKVPVNADFEGGFAVDPQQVAANVKMAADTGIAGLSIEDSSGDETHPLFEFELAVERVAAARQAIDEDLLAGLRNRRTPRASCRTRHKLCIDNPARSQCAGPLHTRLDNPVSCDEGRPMLGDTFLYQPVSQARIPLP